MDRRAFLGFLGGSAAAVAGCTARDGASSPIETTPSPTSRPTGSATTTGLDLREANVMAVGFERRDGDIRFDVTLLHDDDGEDGYANWWQVERLDGSRLGRRELLHAHGTREFTRSATTAVPPDITCVVVRGHDQTHGYGGRAMLVSLDAGATRGVRQGSEPASFEVADCP